MFKNTYKQAYDNIKPDPDYLEKINASIERKQERNQHAPMKRTALKPAIAVCSLGLLFMVAATPVLAKEIPFLYSLIQKYVPALSDSIVPEELSCSSQGIKMQVEAVEVKGNAAEVVVSFTDEEGYDYIRGEVDLYDSYTMHSYGAESNLGGCSFLEYNAQEDKVYFKIDVECDYSSYSDKVTFEVGQLLTNHSKVKKDINIHNRISNPVTKEVELNGWTGEADWDSERALINTEDFTAQVLDLGAVDESLKNDLAITGVAYTDGILRVQMYRGDLKNADMPMALFLVKADGTEVYDDHSVMWQETMNGESVFLEEVWFEVDEEELANSSMYGIYHNIDGCVRGDWEVTFTIG